MMTLKLKGGLGNQMFQYAFVFSFAKKRNMPFRLDISSYKSCNLRKYELGYFNIPNILLTQAPLSLIYDNEFLYEKIIRKLFKRDRPFSSHYFTDSNFKYFKEEKVVLNQLYFDGYWQLEDYFKEYADDIMLLFKKSKLTKESQNYNNLIKIKRSVSLHVRRGDYIKNKSTSNIHGICSLMYYDRAISLFNQRFSDLTYFVFSDDICWCRRNFNHLNNIIFLECKEQIYPQEEIYLMSICDHNIIANSSFSWWGAWLNKNPRKIIIAPKKWYNDYTFYDNDPCPKSWIRL